MSLRVYLHARTPCPRVGVYIHLHIRTPSVHVDMSICTNIHAEFTRGGVYICIFVW